MLIIPALLSDDPAVISDQLERIQEHDTNVSTVQVDVIDGYFADNVTVSPLDLPQFEFGTLSVDLHLMTIEPLDAVYESIDIAKVVPIRGIIAQLEKMSSQENFIEEVKKNHWLPGLSLNAFTPLSAVSKEVWEDLRILQIMGIEAGFQGQAFLEQTYTIIEQARALIDRTNPEVQLYVDGGVTADNIALLDQLGVDVVVAGSSLFSQHDFAHSLSLLEDALV